MSPPSVEACVRPVDRVGVSGVIRKLSITSPLLPFADDAALSATAGVPVSQMTSDGVERGVTSNQQHTSTCSTEERDRIEVPQSPAVMQSPSVSAVSASNYLKDQIISFFQVADNKLAMKLFGNKNALMREKMRQRAVGNWVIHPCSNFRQVSDC